MIITIPGPGGTIGAWPCVEAMARNNGRWCSIRSSSSYRGPEFVFGPLVIAQGAIAMIFQNDTVTCSLRSEFNSMSTSCAQSAPTTLNIELTRRRTLSVPELGTAQTSILVRKRCSTSRRRPFQRSVLAKTRSSPSATILILTLHQSSEFCDC